MKYPTKQEIELADKRRLAEWYRFLPSPGSNFIGSNVFYQKLEEEGRIMDRIVERFREMGMFTPTLSKDIGWEI